MGGLFSSPKAPPLPPMPAAPDPAKSKAELRREALDRARRGRAGTIATGYRGVLSEDRPQGGTGGLKTKLGE